MYYTVWLIPKLQHFPIPSRISPPNPLCLELLHCILGAGQLEAIRAAKSQLPTPQDNNTYKVASWPSAGLGSRLAKLRVGTSEITEVVKGKLFT